MSDFTIPLNDGSRMPWLAFGTGTALLAKDCSDLVSMAITNGITHLDGAQAYRNEESLGVGIKASGKPRSEIYIVTKLWKLDRGESVKQSLEGSLKRLGVDHVDLFLVHTPLWYKGKLKEVWDGMEEVQRAGLTRSIGVSNFNAKHLEEIIDKDSVVPAVNQIEYHPYVLKAIEPILKLHEKYGIVTASYGGQTPLLPNRVAEGPVKAVLEKISEKLSTADGRFISAGQVLIKWIQQRGIVVVTTTSKESRVKEYLEVADIPELTPTDVKEIEEAGASMPYRRYTSVFSD